VTSQIAAGEINLLTIVIPGQRASSQPVDHRFAMKTVLARNSSHIRQIYKQIHTEAPGLPQHSDDQPV
jgi:hypothetical protein